MILGNYQIIKPIIIIKKQFKPKFETNATYFIKNNTLLRKIINKNKLVAFTIVHFKRIGKSLKINSNHNKNNSLIINLTYTLNNQKQQIRS